MTAVKRVLAYKIQQIQVRLASTKFGNLSFPWIPLISLQPLIMAFSGHIHLLFVKTVASY